MYRTILVMSLSTVLSLAGSPTAASQGRGGGPKPKPPTSTANHGSPHGSTAPGSTTHGPKPSSPAHSGARTTHGGSATTAHGSGSPKGPKSTTTPTTSTATRTGATQLTAVQQKLQKNTNLAAKLSSRLPAGTDLMMASQGFRNLGQFVAAVNVSNHLDIPFTQLRSRMVDDNMSLGQAIHDVRPRADSTVEVKRAESDADVLIRTSGETTSTNIKKHSSTKKQG